jgi:hypothetical protein
MKTIVKPKQCCRYTWSLFPIPSIKKVLELNPWLFDHSFNFFAYYDDEKIIPEGVFEIEKNWITDNYVLFSGFCSELKYYIDRVNWDSFGTWYVYIYPSAVKADSPMIIGRDTFLDKAKGYNFADYFMLSDEWRFIHEVQPDLFITRQKKGVMIGSLKEMDLWCIETK